MRLAPLSLPSASALFAGGLACAVGAPLFLSTRLYARGRNDLRR